MHRKRLVSQYCNSELNLKFCENLNFITCDKLNIKLGKTYAKLRIFPKIFWKSGPRTCWNGSYYWCSAVIKRLCNISKISYTPFNRRKIESASAAGKILGIKNVLQMEIAESSGIFVIFLYSFCNCEWCFCAAILSCNFQCLHCL